MKEYYAKILHANQVGAFIINYTVKINHTIISTHRCILFGNYMLVFRNTILLDLPVRYYSKFIYNSNRSVRQGTGCI